MKRNMLLLFVKIINRVCIENRGFRLHRFTFLISRLISKHVRNFIPNLFLENNINDLHLFSGKY